jgi:hypothetical protein
MPDPFLQIKAVEGAFEAEQFVHARRAVTGPEGLPEGGLQTARSLPGSSAPEIEGREGTAQHGLGGVQAAFGIGGDPRLGLPKGGHGVGATSLGAEDGDEGAAPTVHYFKIRSHRSIPP